MQESKNIAPEKDLKFDDDDDSDFSFDGTKAGEDQKPTRSELEDIALLLDGDDADNDGEDDQKDADDNTDDSDTGSEKNDKTAPKSLEALAEKLGVKTADLYGIEISFAGDGEKTATLGEMKDAFGKVNNLEVERLEFEETRTAKESEFLRSTQELTELVGMLPKAALSKDLLNAVAARRAETAARETKLTLTAIPSWKNEETETADKKSMSEYMAKYGFPANYADSIIDHRTIVFVRDAMLREQRITKALEQVKTVRKPGHKQRPAPAKPAKTRQRRGPRVRNEVAQVAELLDG